MRLQLLDLGYTLDQIRDLTPIEAADIIKQQIRSQTANATKSDVIHSPPPRDDVINAPAPSGEGKKGDEVVVISESSKLGVAETSKGLENVAKREGEKGETKREAEGKRGNNNNAGKQTSKVITSKDKEVLVS
jgi:hypothetical protein